ncbi:hypothetical protein J1N35_007654, partial [Gossypium stocksii]
VTPVLAILAETFRSLNACRRAVKAVSYQVFLRNYSPLKEIVAIPRRDDVSEENWIALLQNFQKDDFIPATYGLAQCEFSYKGDHYKKLVKEISSACNQTCHMKIVDVCPVTTPEYTGWWSWRVNDNIPVPSLEGARPIEEYLQVVPSELEIIKQDFERKSSEFEK